MTELAQRSSPSDIVARELDLIYVGGPTTPRIADSGITLIVDVIVNYRFWIIFALVAEIVFSGQTYLETFKGGRGLSHQSCTKITEVILIPL